MGLDLKGVNDWFKYDTIWTACRYYLDLHKSPSIEYIPEPEWISKNPFDWTKEELRAAETMAIIVYSMTQREKK